MNVKKQKQFTLKWFKELGWWDNPFATKVLMPPERFIAGYDKERQKLNYFVIEGFPLGFVKGEKGTGKTTLLLWLWHVMQKVKEKRAVFYTEKMHKGVLQLLIEELIGIHERIGMRGYYGLRLHKGVRFIKRTVFRKETYGEHFYRKLYTKAYEELNKRELFAYIQKKLGERQLLLLIDDVELLTDRDYDFIMDLYHHDVPIQVVCAGTKETVDKSKLYGFRKDDLKIYLRDMSWEDVKGMVQKRISYVGGRGLDPFNEHQLKAIYASCDKNPSKIVKKCLDQSIKKALNRMMDKEKKWEKQKWVPPSIRNQQKKEEEPDLNEAIRNIDIPFKKKQDEDGFFVKEPKKTNDYKIRVIDNTASDMIEVNMKERDPSGYKIREVGSNPVRRRRKTARKRTARKRTVRRTVRKTARRSRRKR